MVEQAKPHAAAPTTVEVPLNRKPLVAMDAGRVRKLRRHLVESLRAMRTMKRPAKSDPAARPEPDGFAGTVARAACALCGGWCCKGGEEHAYLDERTMARVRLARPELDAAAVIALYVRAVPALGYAASCVFHGADGCTLDRSLRSDVCNNYFCSGLGRFVQSPEAVASAVIAAGDGAARRVSAVMTAAERLGFTTGTDQQSA